MARLNMARTNLQIKVGTYVGTGAVNIITDTAFPPDLVIIKGGSNHAVFRVKQNQGDSTCYLATNLANLTGSITGLTTTGFVLGTDATVNANGTTYFYIAIRGAAAEAIFKTFWYVGSGADNRDLTTTGINFTPDFVHIKQDGANVAPDRLSLQTGDIAFHLLGTTPAANIIQNLQANGFQLGTSVRSNGSASNYYGFALKHLPGVFISGQYTGNGTSQSITGLGFQPDWVIVANIASASAAMLKTNKMTGLTSHVINNFNSVTNGILSLDSNGFSVGSTAAANGSTNTIYYLAGKEGSFSAPITTRTVL